MDLDMDPNYNNRLKLEACDERSICIKTYASSRQIDRSICRFDLQDGV